MKKKKSAEDVSVHSSLMDAPALETELGLGHNPLDDEDPVVAALYARPAARTKLPGRRPLQEGRSWRLVTFSFYEDDVARLDALLLKAKKRGHRRANRSQIMRLALRQVDISKLPELV